MSLPMSSYGYVKLIGDLQEQVTRLTAALDGGPPVAVADLQPGDRVVLTRTVVTTIEVCEGRRMVVFQPLDGCEPTLTCGAQATFRRAVPNTTPAVHRPSPPTGNPCPGNPSIAPQASSERVTRMGFNQP